MLIQIPDILSALELTQFRQTLAQAPWHDGRITAGYQSARAKDNLQLHESNPVAQALRARVLDALGRSDEFFAAALPRRIFPPLFNCYRDGQSFGFHVDNAVRYDRTGDVAVPVRTDVSCTLFLSDPDDYEGGELVIQDTFGQHAVKLPAGHLVLYPASSLHRVTPVTRGARIAAFFWLQSLVRDDAQRRLLWDLDLSIRQLGTEMPDHPALVRLTGVYHNLLRRWSDV